jgi:hypothetical protein
VQARANLPSHCDPLVRARATDDPGVADDICSRPTEQATVRKQSKMTNSAFAGGLV